jgi:hypothetical protein
MPAVICDAFGAASTSQQQSKSEARRPALRETPSPTSERLPREA